MGDLIGAELQDELTDAGGGEWSWSLALGTDGFVSCPSTLSVRIHVCGSGDSLRRPEKVSASPDLPARGTVLRVGEPEMPKGQKDDGLDSCPGMISIRIHAQGDMGNSRRPAKLSVTPNLPCINERVGHA